jgi:Ni,Fe-hydrogenase III large subunit
VIYEKLVTKNIIFIKRTENIGIVSPDMALRYGMTGPNLRGSGIAYDIRKNEPYSVYPEFDFEIPVGQQGDCLDRYMVRVREIEQSLRIIEQALDRLPDGPIRAKVPKNIKLTPGGCKRGAIILPGGRWNGHALQVENKGSVLFQLKLPSGTGSRNSFTRPGIHFGELRSGHTGNRPVEHATKKH